jgi:hypothetical protein
MVGAACRECCLPAETWINLKKPMVKDPEISVLNVTDVS